MRYFPRTVALPASAAVVLLLGAGCSDEDDSGAGEVVVTAVDYAFEDVPDSIAAGTRVLLANASDDELHELVALRISDDSDISIDDLAALPEEELGQHLVAGPPALVLIAAPGEEPGQRGAGTFSEPGRYALVCFVPTGADPDEFLAAASEAGDGPPEVEAGPPHLVHGMYAELTVE